MENEKALGARTPKHLQISRDGSPRCCYTRVTSATLTLHPPRPAGKPGYVLHFCATASHARVVCPLVFGLGCGRPPDQVPVARVFFCGRHTAPKQSISSRGRCYYQRKGAQSCKAPGFNAPTGSAEQRRAGESAPWHLPEAVRMLYRDAGGQRTLGVRGVRLSRTRVHWRTAATTNTLKTRISHTRAAMNVGEAATPAAVSAALVKWLPVADGSW